MSRSHAFHDRAYFLRRALEEHRAAASAEDRGAALVHMELARLYEDRAAKGAGAAASAQDLASSRA